MNNTTQVEIEFRESDEEGEQGQQIQQQQQVMEQEEKIVFKKIFATALILELFNSNNQFLSRRDVVLALEYIIKQLNGKYVQNLHIQKPIRPKDIVLEPILSTSALKCCGIIEVSADVFESLLLPQQSINFGNKNSITMRFEFSFFDFLQFDQCDLFSNGRFSNDFVILKSQKENNKGTAIAIVMNKKDQQIYTIKKVPLRVDISWQKLYYQEIPQIREIKAMLRLQHYNVVRLFSWWIEWEENAKKRKTFYLYQQQEYVSFRGHNNLFEFSLGQLNGLTVNDKKLVIKSIIPQILDGIEYINNQGFFHRDIKLENILVTSDFFGRIVIRICDFDWSKTHLNEDAKPVRWSVQSKQSGTPICVSNKSNKGSVYDLQEELFQFGMVFLDLCQTDTQNREDLHKTAKENNYPEVLQVNYGQEIEVIKSLINKKLFKSISELRESEVYKNYIKE